MKLLVWWIYWHCFVVVNAVVGIGVFFCGEVGMVLVLLLLLLLLKRNLMKLCHGVLD
jgi:hypothetical protein